MTMFTPSEHSEGAYGDLGWVQSLMKTPTEQINTSYIAKALREARKYAEQGRVFDSAQDLISTFARERWGQVLAYPPATTVDAIGKGETALFLLAMMKGISPAVRNAIITDAKALDAKLASVTFIESRDPAKVAEYSHNRAKAAVDWGNRAIASGASKDEVYALLRWLQYLLSDAVTEQTVGQRQEDLSQQTMTGQASELPGLVLSEVEKKLKRKRRKEREKRKRMMLFAAAAGIISFGALSAWFATRRKKESSNVA